MLLDDVISNFPMLTGDAICVSYRGSLADQPKIVWVNDAFCSMFSVAEEMALGRHPSWIIHKSYAEDFTENVVEAAMAGEGGYSQDTLCVSEEGREFWTSILKSFIPDEESAGLHDVVVIRDINDLKNREQSAELALIENQSLLGAVEQAQTRLISALETTADPFAIYDRKDRLVIWNPAFSESVSDDADRLVRGMKLEEVLRVGLEFGRFPDAEGRSEEWIEERLEKWKNEARSEYLMTSRDREYRVIRSRTPSGDHVVLQVDISDFLDQQRELRGYAEKLESANQEISHQALHDELTGLGNRRYLKLKMDEFIAHRRREGDEVAALHVDLDRFKQINDTMGHAVGDHVLKVVADILRANLRSEDVVARIGGDEFVVLVRCHANSDHPEKLAERLIAAASEPVTFEGRPCRFGASIGIARTPLIDEEELLTSSDVALYRAKTSGRSQVAVFDNMDLVNLRARKRLGDDILQGLERDEFIAVYQPQIDPFTTEVLGFEALTRWLHPERGLLMPSEFAAAAAEVNAAKQIDSSVFRNAIAEFCAAFEEDVRPINLSFDTSHARLVDPELPSDIGQFSGAGQICLELSDAACFEDDSEATKTAYETLRNVGVLFEVDGFGTGPASFLALRRLKPERLKIDGRLVKPIDDCETSQQLLRSIIETGQALGIGVTACGVETREQVRVLCEFGCDRVQGPLFSRPLLLGEVIGEFLPRGMPKTA